MNKTEALPEFLRQRFTGNWLLSDPPQQQKDWLCHAAADEIERLRTENEKLRAATGSLVRSLSGCWYAFEPSLRREMGNTNYHCVKEKMDEVEALLNFRAARAAIEGEKG